MRTLTKSNGCPTTTAHTPPTPPATRERKLERVCFEASTTSLLTSSAEGIEGPVDDDDDEEEDIVDAKKKREENKVQGEGKGKEGELVVVMGWNYAIGFWRDRGSRGF